MHNAQQFPSQQEDGKKNHEDSHEFAKTQAAAMGFEAPRRQRKDVQGGEAENYNPKNVVDVAATTGVALKQQYRGRRRLNSHPGSEREENTAAHKNGKQRR